MNSFTKQDERPQSVPNSADVNIHHLSHRSKIRLLRTYPCMKITYLTMHTRRYVVNYLTAKNSRCEGQRRRINSVVQESQAFPDPIRWMKLLIWTN